MHNIYQHTILGQLLVSEPHLNQLYRNFSSVNFEIIDLEVIPCHIINITFMDQAASEIEHMWLVCVKKVSETGLYFNVDLFLYLDYKSKQHAY